MAPVVLTMERRPCLGDCPVYAVTLYRDGTVEYHGKFGVRARGRRVGHVAPAALRKLEDAFTRAGFPHLGSYPNATCTDQARVMLSYGGRTVTHSHGDPRAPLELFTLEYEIDDHLNTKRWVGRDHLFLPGCGMDEEPAAPASRSPQPLEGGQDRPGEITNGE